MDENTQKGDFTVTVLSQRTATAFGKIRFSIPNCPKSFNNTLTFSPRILAPCVQGLCTVAGAQFSPYRTLLGGEKAFSLPDIQNSRAWDISATTPSTALGEVYVENCN